MCCTTMLLHGNIVNGLERLIAHLPPRCVKLRHESFVRPRLVRVRRFAARIMGGLQRMFAAVYWIYGMLEPSDAVDC